MLYDYLKATKDDKDKPDGDVMKNGVQIDKTDIQLFTYYGLLIWYFPSHLTTSVFVLLLNDCHN